MSAPSAIVTPNRPRLLEPGISGEGVERYLVHGGGSVSLPIEAGDRIEITDPEGGQVALRRRLSKLSALRAWLTTNLWEPGRTSPVEVMLML